MTPQPVEPLPHHGSPDPWEPNTGAMIASGGDSSPPPEATVLQAVVAGLASAIHGARFGHSGLALGHMAVAYTDCPSSAAAREAKILVHVTMPGRIETSNLVVSLEFVNDFDEELVR